MDTISHCIDWLQYSCQWPKGIPSWPDRADLGQAIARSCLPGSVDIKPLQTSEHYPWKGYDTVYPFNIADVNVHTQRKDQKMGVIMTGEHLKTSAEIGIDITRLLTTATTIGDKVSRIDFAIDVKGDQHDPLDIYTAWEDGTLQTSARSVNPVSTCSKNSQGGVKRASTVYIGSRTSDRFVRCYDKMAQTMGNDPWIRIELVLRDMRADYAAREMVRSSVEKVGLYLLRDFIQEGPDWYQNAVKGETSYCQGPGRKQTKTEQWLAEVVLPTLIKTIQERTADGSWDLYDRYQKALDQLCIGRNANVQR